MPDTEPGTIHTVVKVRFAFVFVSSRLITSMVEVSSHTVALLTAMQHRFPA